MQTLCTPSIFIHLLPLLTTMSPLLVLILATSLIVLAFRMRPVTTPRAAPIRMASLAFLAGALSACGDAPEPGLADLVYPVPAHAATPSRFAALPDVPALTTLYAHSTINIRSEPSRTASIIRTLATGDSVIVGEPVDDWSAVIEGGATTGYVSRSTNSLQTSRPAAIRQLLPSGRSRSSGRGSASSRRYYRGPRGGCYYYTDSGNKQYVDRSVCN